MPLKASSSSRLSAQLSDVSTVRKDQRYGKLGIDARPESVSYAAIAICPHFNSKFPSTDDKPAMAVKGVKQVVQIEDAVR